MTRTRLDRRAFLKNAGVTALVGTVGTGSSMAAVGIAQDAAGSDHDFDNVVNRIGTNCSKWDGPIARFNTDIEVGMGIADMDFRAAPCITKALAQQCQHENWGYTRSRGGYTQAIVNWNQQRYGLDIDPSTLVLSNGVHPAIIAALEAFSPPGSKVLMSTPIYNGFYGDLRACNLLKADSPMTLVDGRYSVDFDDLESRMGDDTKTLILCNPQNPTGNCWSPEDMMRIGEMCLRHGVVVLSDEIHCDFVTKGQKYTPFASLPDKDIVNNSLTFKAASKSFSISGMKSAWFFSTNPDYLRRVRANNRVDLTTLGMVANQAALTDGGEWLDQLLPYIDANHDLVESYTKEKMPLVKYRKAQGTFLAWLDISQVIDKIGAGQVAAEASSSGRRVLPEAIVERWLAENAKVHLNPGTSYGTGGAGHMRMNIGTSRKLVQLALDNMASALESV